jgi:hypothetical protein
MTSRAEVTARFARAYVKASKKNKGQILDQVVEVTGWSRDNARRRLTAAAKRPPGSGRPVAKRPRKPRAPKFSYDTLKVLQKVWAGSGGQCGKYLAASMRVQLDALERHGELVFGRDRYSRAVRAELLAMSAASIDRYLAPANAKDQIKGKTTTKPSPLLRSSVKIRKATDEIESAPGFFEGDTVAHCGPTLKGEFARTLNLTCVHTQKQHLLRLLIEDVRVTGWHVQIRLRIALDPPPPHRPHPTGPTGKTSPHPRPVSVSTQDGLRSVGGHGRTQLPAPETTRPPHQLDTASAGR